MAKSDGLIFSAPICVVKVGTKTIAQIQNVSFSENIDRARVKGLGELTFSQFPPLSIICTGTFTVNSVRFKTDGIPSSLKRASGTAQRLVDTITLAEEPVSISLYRKRDRVINSKTGIVEEVDYEEYATIKDFYLESETMDISDNSIATKTQTFVYSTPIYYNDSII